MCVGAVQIKTRRRVVWKLHNVRYISNLKKNLILSKQPSEGGYALTFQNNSWKVGEKLNMLW